MITFFQRLNSSTVLWRRKRLRGQSVQTIDLLRLVLILLSFFFLFFHNLRKPKPSWLQGRPRVTKNAANLWRILFYSGTNLTRFLFFFFCEQSLFTLIFLYCRLWMTSSSQRRGWRRHVNYNYYYYCCCSYYFTFYRRAAASRALL